MEVQLHIRIGITDNLITREEFNIMGKYGRVQGNGMTQKKTQNNKRWLSTKER